jgi:nitrogen regulatory protein P-II 1
MKEIKAIIQPFMLHRVLAALHRIEGLPGVTIADVRGIGAGCGELDQIGRSKLEIMIPDALVEPVVEAIQTHAHTGNAGDGHIFVIPIEETVRIRTGERGENPMD